MTSIQTLLLTIAMIYPPSQAAGEIYKWVDEYGRVQYSDKPNSKNSEEISITTTQSSPTLPSDEERRQARDRLLEVFREDREQARINAAEEKSSKTTHLSNCRLARSQLEQLQQAQYLYDENAAGERVIYSESERNAAVDRANANVEKWCNYHKP